MSDLDARKRAHEAANRITVGELRDRLAAFDDTDEVAFGSEHPLVFRRLKNRGPFRGPAVVHIELDELTDDAMRDEMAWAWVRRVGELADAVLFLEGIEGTVRPTKAETAELKTLVAELRADPSLLGGAEGYVWSTHAATQARAARALLVVTRWAGLD